MALDPDVWGFLCNIWMCIKNKKKSCSSTCENISWLRNIFSPIVQPKVYVDLLTNWITLLKINKICTKSNESVGSQTVAPSSKQQRDNKILARFFRVLKKSTLKSKSTKKKVVLLLQRVQVCNHLSNSNGFHALWIIRSAKQPLEVLAAHSLNTEVECWVLAV